MTYEIVHEFPHEMIFQNNGPFISLYQTTHKHSPENKQDQIRYKNLLSQIRASLEREYPKIDVEEILTPFKDIQKDRDFWIQATHGLAILATIDQAIVYRLPRATGDIAIVADNPYIKPLLRNYQSVDKYHILGLEQENFVLYEGDRFGLEKVEFPEEDDITKKEVLGEETTEPHHNYRFGNAAPTRAVLHHGHGGRKDEVDKDADRYFRYVDEYIQKNYSSLSKKPLLLSTLDEHFGHFRELSQNPYLLEEGIRKDFRSLSESELSEEAWRVVEPLYLQKTQELVDRFHQLHPEQAAQDPAEIARAVVEGRVETLLIESDKVIPGRVHLENGRIETGELDDPKIGDLLNAIGLIALNNQAHVVVLPAERMPTKSGLAAIYRY